MLKKYSTIIILLLVLILFIVIIIKDNLENKENPEQTSKPTVTNTVEEDDKELTSLQYEQIIKGFLDSLNFAIEKQENSFLEQYLEVGSKFEERILKQVETKNKTEFEIVFFKSLKNIKGKIHTVEFELVKDNKTRIIIYKIKHADGKFFVIDELE
ncbi:MAG: hypothetical protein JW924_14235 [Fusobacteriaceae bacterium]|nr:hypothetical protein [Fusobacteriaceae bacterium]